MGKACITKLVLTDFRNFIQKQVVFDPKATLITGNNGQGKTNILEAISLLSTGRSFRAKLLSDCVREGTQIAHVGIAFRDGDEEDAYNVSIVSAGSKLPQRTSTRFKKNGVAKRRTDIVGSMKSVVFRPEDLELVTQGPSYKRAYLDDVLIQVSKPYQAAIKEYEKALKNRNKLILLLREGLTSRKDFVFWDALLIKNGDIITRMRAEFVHFINTFVPFPIRGNVEYDKSLIHEERIRQYANEEVAAGKTLVGPHRDSLHISLDLGDGNLRDVERFGSRGQQRMAVLWLKLAALLFIEEQTDQSPILLLDDIFSELDEQNREIVLQLLANYQSIITSAEELSMLPSSVQAAKLIQLEKET